MTAEKYPSLPAADFSGSRAVPKDTPLYTAEQVHAAIDAAREQDRARAAAPQAAVGVSDEQIDAAALSRYKVVPAHGSMFWSHAVVAGDGSQQLYVGRDVECQNMAAKFAGAFLDGAFLALSASKPEAPAPATFMTEDRACEWAWGKVREDVGTKGWTTGDSCNFYGFFRWGWIYRGQYELQRTAAASAEAPANEGGTMTDAMRSLIEGMSVSVDVSTGDHDAGHRYFGTVTLVQDDAFDKLGVTLLVQDAKPNFALAAPAQGAAVPDAKVLAALVSQIEKCDPVDDYGHKFTMNAAYLAAKGSL